jgi:hypothetical protein
MSLSLATAGSGVARTAHYVIPTGASTPIQTLLLEPQRTNRVLQSQTLADAAWVATNVTVTANNATAPDGTATADTLNATTGGGSLVQAVTFTGATGPRPFAVFLKAGTAAATDLEVYDVTAAASLRVVRVTWTGGVPAVTSVSGAGTIHPVVRLANGWYRIRFNADAVIAGAGRTEVRLFPASASTGTVIAWGVTGEEKGGGGVTVTPTQYIATVGAAVTRNQDVLTFPVAFPPQALTLYYRGIDQGFADIGNIRSLLALGSTVGAITTPGTFVMQTNLTTNTTLRLYYVPISGATVTSQVSVASVQMGDIIEVRMVITASWEVLAGIAVNGGAESLGILSAAGSASANWDTNIVTFGASQGTRNDMPNAVTHLVIAAGEQSLATMRTLAGVA